MAIDSAIKRRKALSAVLGWGASVLPAPDGDIDGSDKEQVLKRYSTFLSLITSERHYPAMLRMWPVKGLTLNE